MPDPIALNTDGPHSPDYTRQVADTLAEAVRVLIYATRGDAPGLHNIAHAYDLLGALYTATGRLDQLFTQIETFLKARESEMGNLPGSNAHVQVLVANSCLGGAASATRDVTVLLEQTQNAIGGLGHR